MPLVIGHSMGGKTALLFALTHAHQNASLLGGLVSLDASPASYSHSHSRVFETMANFDFEKVNDFVAKLQRERVAQGDSEKLADKRRWRDISKVRQRAFKELGSTADYNGAFSLTVSECAFVLENLDFANLFRSSVPARLSWVCNLEVLQKKESEVHSFPEMNASCHLPTLFLGGTESSRLTYPEYLKQVEKLFPQHNVKILNKAGHFLYRTHAKEVISAIVKYSLTRYK